MRICMETVEVPLAARGPARIFLDTLTTPRGRTPSEDLALTLALDAASDKCWASSLKSGRECLAAAWACFPSCGCQARLYRGWQLCGDAIV